MAAGEDARARWKPHLFLDDSQTLTTNTCRLHVSLVGDAACGVQADLFRLVSMAHARVRGPLAVPAIALGVSTALRAQGAQQPTADDQTLAQQQEELARVGEQLVNKTCDTTCHGLDKLDELRRTPR